MTITANVKNRITVCMGDIVTLKVVKDNQQSLLKVDAIVNSANSELAPGGGLSGAIHAAAGSELEQECLQLNGCETGQAKLTKGYNLPVKHIIHTVSPIWTGGDNDEDKLLAQSYKSCLELVVKHKIKTIAFPSISTGIFAFPVIKACRIAMKTVVSFLTTHPEINHVYFVMNWDNFRYYGAALEELS